MTNYEYLKSLSIDKLAEELDRASMIKPSLFEESCQYDMECPAGNTCKDCMLDWLKKEREPQVAQEFIDILKKLVHDFKLGLDDSILFNPKTGDKDLDEARQILYRQLMEFSKTLSTVEKRIQ